MNCEESRFEIQDVSATKILNHIFTTSLFSSGSQTSSLGGEIRRQDPTSSRTGAKTAADCGHLEYHQRVLMAVLARASDHHHVCDLYFCVGGRSNRLQYGLCVSHLVQHPVCPHEQAARHDH